MEIINENTNGTKTDLYGMPCSVNSQFDDESLKKFIWL